MANRSYDEFISNTMNQQEKNKFTEENMKNFNRLNNISDFLTHVFIIIEFSDFRKI